MQRPVSNVQLPAPDKISSGSAELTKSPPLRGDKYMLLAHRL